MVVEEFQLIELTDRCIEKLAEAFGRRKTGKWLRSNHGLKFQCNCCRRVQDGLTNYCPNCGARMECEKDAIH